MAYKANSFAGFCVVRVFGFGVVNGGYVVMMEVRAVDRVVGTGGSGVVVGVKVNVVVGGGGGLGVVVVVVVVVVVGIVVGIVVGDGVGGGGGGGVAGVVVGVVVIAANEYNLAGDCGDIGGDVVEMNGA